MRRVLFQPRPEAPSSHGGESITVPQAVAALRRAGVEADISTDPHADLSRYDLVQLFTIWMPESSLPYVVNARRQGKPIALAPVYWSTARYLREKQRMLFEWVRGYTESPHGEQERAIEDTRARIDSLAARVLIGAAGVLLPASQEECKQLTADYGVAPERQWLVYSGVDPIFLRPSPESFVHKYGLRDFVLSVGRIEERKNQFSLVRALKGTGVKLVLIGHAADRRYLEACRREGGSDLVILDHIPHEEMPSLYAAAKVHALVSWMECASLANLEAGLAGCNLVVDEQSSAREYVGDRAWYCDPADYASIRAAVLDALHASRRADLPDHILANFTWDRVAAQFIAAYESLLSTPPRTASDADLVALLTQLAGAQRELLVLREGQAGRLWEENNRLRSRGLRRWLRR